MILRGPDSDYQEMEFDWPSLGPIFCPGSSSCGQGQGQMTQTHSHPLDKQEGQILLGEEQGVSFSEDSANEQIT